MRTRPAQGPVQQSSVPLRRRRSESMEEPTEDFAQELRDFILEVQEDYKELRKFWPVRVSFRRTGEFSDYLFDKCLALQDKFEGKLRTSNDPQANADYVLIKAYITRILDELRLEEDRLREVVPFFKTWSDDVVEFCEDRQLGTHLDFEKTASRLSGADEHVARLTSEIIANRFERPHTRICAYHAANLVEDLRTHLQEAHDFYAGYNPMFTWWVSRTWRDLDGRLSQYASAIREHLLGIKPDMEDPTVGQPAGRKGIEYALQSEFIAYTPEELIKIAEKQYHWCKQRAMEASRDMGYGNNWQAAQKRVKEMHVEPGQQVALVRELAEEAIHYIWEHDMVTVPEIARKYWRTFMMSPARQKVNPFFLGGDSIIVAYPTSDMAYEDKLMSMRANNRHFSRSVVLHELIPGHHLQFHYMTRYNTHRQLFQTPFSTEGWAFYWELILWNRGFAVTPEDKLGMLFWHMHRCIRIIFSLKFHLGEWTPAQCVDALVERVGHEQSTAEGEVRRSFNGDYGPLYQVGYMIGALQLIGLRKEFVESGQMSEKDFHDRILKENNMPIEILRALLRNETLPASYEAKWRFYKV